MEPRDKHGRLRQESAPGLTGALRRLPAYVYLADLFRGRHILEVGCGDGAGAAYLARSGAASVIGIDRSAASIDVARARHRVANLSFAVADFAKLDLEDRAVDVVCAPGGAELGRWPAFLDEARRVLARDGCIVMAVPNGDRPGVLTGMSFHDIAGRLAPVFGEVRMIGVTPFVGFSLVEYADADVLDVELDTSLAGMASRDPVTDYVAVAGAALGGPRGFMVVEVPPTEGLPAIAHARGVEIGDRALEERLAEAETTASDALARLADLEHAGAKGARGEELELRKRLARAAEERAGAEAEVQALRARLSRAEEEIGQVAAQAARELGEARRAVHAANGRLQLLEGQLAEAREVEHARGSAVDLQRKVVELETRLRAQAEEMATRALESAPLEVMARAAEQHQAEMRQQEAALAERDAYVDELRQELDDVALAERAAVEAARDASVRLADLEAELLKLRPRLAAAEGELLRQRAHPAVAAAPAGPDPRVAELEQALAERSAAVDKATARWKEAEAKTDDLWRKIGELQKELVQTREQGVETARQQRQAAQIALTRAVDEASKKLVSSQDQSLRTEKERAELEREVGALRERLAEQERVARARIAELEAELAEGAGSLEAARGALAERYEQLVAARAELGRTRVELAEVQAELARARTPAPDIAAAPAPAPSPSAAPPPAPATASEAPPLDGHLPGHELEAALDGISSEIDVAGHADGPPSGHHDG